MYDLIVIGAGPCGSVAAKEATECGLKTLLLEKKKHVGRPVHCTGLLSKRTIETLKISSASILNEIKGAYIYFPNNKGITIDAGEIKAYVVDREAFDKELLMKAEKEGSEVSLETQGIGIDENRIRVNYKGEEKWIKAKVFIGAYGANTKTNFVLNYLPPPKKNLCGLQAIVSYKAKDKNFVELFFGNRYSDSFFGWTVPLDGKLAKVGLVASNFKKAKDGLKELIKQIGSLPPKTPVPGIIPIGPSRITVRGNFLICGDAAGHAKPTSGGGVYTGTYCATIASRIVAEHLKEGTSLNKYDKRWRKEIGKELKMGFIVHEILTNLSDNHLNKIFGIFSREENIEWIKKYGDIDYPSTLIRKFISTPSMWKNIVPFSLFKNFKRL